MFEESEGANPSGAKSIRIFRSAENPNEITVLAEWDTMDNARRFSIPPEVMKRAGVVGQVVIRFLDEVSLP
ncbi:MAG: cyclase [Chloroflexi bacterium]|nr:cyclase [Chloroflexota bacterium]